MTPVVQRPVIYTIYKTRELDLLFNTVLKINLENKKGEFYLLTLMLADLNLFNHVFPSFVTLMPVHRSFSF